MRIETAPIDASALRELLPEGGDPADPPGFAANQLIGHTIPAPEGVTVTYEGMVQYRSTDTPPDLQFLVEFAEAVSVALVVAWLRDRFRGKVQRFTINRRWVDLDDEGQVRGIVEEEIKGE